VICDRFTDATYAYQGAGRGVPRTGNRAARTTGAAGTQAGSDPAAGRAGGRALSRAKRRNADQEGDRFERERESFFERVRRGYLDIAAAEPQRVKIIDAARELEEVGRLLRVAVGDFLSSTGLSSTSLSSAANDSRRGIVIGRAAR